ncbi:MAG: J domain-containing protein, partial [Anaerolineae bacterium]|nr:J domain-containing protein [Anaerolineae bacterium]
GGQPGGFDWSPFMGGQPGGVRVEYGDASQVFSEFFNTFFGGAPARGASTGGSFSSLDDLLRSGGTSVRAGARDLETTVDITLDEAYHGTTRMVTIGSRRLQVKIPAGARTGTVVRLSGKGAASGGQPGDLYLNVVVQSDPRFEREGDDLHQEIVLDLYVAVLGGEVQVTTLSGTVTLKINPGTQPGQVIRLRGHGMPRIKHTDAHGDMYVRIGVELPESLSAKERALFRELASLRGYHPPE